MVVQNILDEVFLQRPPLMALFEVLAYILIGVFLAFSIPKLRPYTALVELIFVIGGIYAIDHLFFFPKGYWVLIVYPSLMCVSIFPRIDGLWVFDRRKRKGRDSKSFPILSLKERRRSGPDRSSAAAARR